MRLFCQWRQTAWNMKTYFNGFWNIRHKEIRIWALAGQETVRFFCARKEVEVTSGQHT